MVLNPLWVSKFRPTFLFQFPTELFSSYLLRNCNWQFCHFSLSAVFNIYQKTKHLAVPRGNKNNLFSNDLQFIISYFTTERSSNKQIKLKPFFLLEYQNRTTFFLSLNMTIWLKSQELSFVVKTVLWWLFKVKSFLQEKLNASLLSTQRPKLPHHNKHFCYLKMFDFWNYLMRAIISRGLYIFTPFFTAVYNQEQLIIQTTYVLKRGNSSKKCCGL